MSRDGSSIGQRDRCLRTEGPERLENGKMSDAAPAIGLTVDR